VILNECPTPFFSLPLEPLKSHRAVKFARYAILLLLLLGLLAVLWTQLERIFVFFPTPEIIYTPAQTGLKYEEVFFTTDDGQRLNGWFVPGYTDVTWLWFHGNGGNISHRVDEIAQIHHRLGVNLFIFDYRGYGKSEGVPSERSTYRDARTALAYLQERPDVNPEKIIYFGQSLGAAVAVELAAHQPPLGLVLVAPFVSLSDMSRILYPQLPAVPWLVRNRYNSLAHLSSIHCPLLILHGDRDTIVPISQGRKLFNAANEPKQFQVLYGAGHNDTYIAGGDIYWDALSEFLDGLSK
jgi:fermentation-respiration switch protein FrsA (DUF1100 family)